MGMSYRLKAYRSENDKKYQAYKNIFDACNDLDIELPKEVKEYFADADEAEDALAIPMTVGVNYKYIEDPDIDGFEVALKDLPKGTEKLVFSISY